MNLGTTLSAIIKTDFKLSTLMLKPFSFAELWQNRSSLLPKVYIASYIPLTHRQGLFNWVQNKPHNPSPLTNG